MKASVQDQKSADSQGIIKAKQVTDINDKNMYKDGDGSSFLNDFCTQHIVNGMGEVVIDSQEEKANELRETKDVSFAAAPIDIIH